MERATTSHTGPKFDPELPSVALVSTAQCSSRAVHRVCTQSLQAHVATQIWQEWFLASGPSKITNIYEISELGTMSFIILLLDTKGQVATGK